MDVSACGGAVPDPRHYQQAAWFFTDDPIDLPSGDGSLERGVVLYGGKTESFSGFNDLWLFDLSNLGVEDYCPWHELLSSGANDEATFGGALVYRPSQEEFVLVGGYTIDAAGGIEASSQVRVLDLHDLAGGFASRSGMSSVPNLDYRFADVGSEICLPGVFVLSCPTDTGGGTYSEVVEDPCDVHPSQDYIDACNVTDPTCFEDLLQGCDDDPFCDGGTEDAGLDGVYTIGFTENAPGLGYAATIYDPVGDSLELHGGTTGCEGGSCSDWQGLFDADTTGGEAYEAANSEHVVDVSFSGTAASLSSWTVDLSLHAPSGWPQDASYGLTRSGGAAVGMEWSLASRSWTHAAGDVESVVVGGALYQEVSPGQQWTLNSTPYPPCDLEGVDYPSGDWEQFDNPFAALSGGLVDDTVFHLDSSGEYQAYDLGGAVPPTTAPAVVGVSNGRFLIAGGKDGSHADGYGKAWLVDPSITGTDAVDAITALERYGASLVYDPISRKAYVFGGSMSSSQVGEITLDDSMDAGTTSTFSTSGTVEVDLVSDSTGSTWANGGAWTTEHTCTDTDCFADTIQVHVSTNDTDELNTLEVEVSYDGGTTWTTPMEDTQETPLADSTSDHTQVNYRLPRVLLDGEDLQVRVEYDRSPSTDYASIGDVNYKKANWRFFELLYGSSASPQTGWWLGALPAWPGVGDDAQAAREQRLPIDLQVTTPTGAIVLAPGTPDTDPPTGTVTWSGYVDLMPDEVQVYVLQGVSRVDDGTGTPLVVTVTDGTSTANLYPFIDDGIGASETTDIEDYLRATSSDTWSADLAFVVDRLGDLPTSSMNVAFLRAYEGGSSSTTGLHMAGTTLVLEHDSSGSWLDSAEQGWKTLVHETAHWYLGEYLHTSGETAWFGEALPETLAIQRYPDEGASRLTSGVEDMIDTYYILERDGKDYTTRYEVGPYVLTQLYWLVMADVGITADYDGSFWGAWAGLLTGHAYGDTLAASELEAQLPSASTLSSFYDEWIAGDSYNTPMLALTEFEQDTGFSTSDTWTVEPVQQYMHHTWKPYTDVPFVIGCYPKDDVGTPAFEACSYDGAALVGDPLNVDSISSGALVPSSALGGSTALPAQVMLISADRLLPGGVIRNHLDALARSGISWQLRCGPAQADPDCTVDPDGDGYPSDGDCFEAVDTANPTHDGDDAYPFQLSPYEDYYDATGAPTDRDFNCDGWTRN